MSEKTRCRESSEVFPVGGECKKCVDIDGEGEKRVIKGF